MQLDADEDGSPFFSAPVAAPADAAATSAAGDAPATESGDQDEQERPETRGTDGSETVAASSTADEEEEGQTDSHAAAVATAQSEG